MDQQRIKELLYEAARLTASEYIRFSQIQCELGDAIYKTTSGSVNEDKTDSLRLILDQALVATRNHRPDLLPTLFPVIAIICGDRLEGKIVADPDWSLVDPPKS